MTAIRTIGLAALGAAVLTTTALAQPVAFRAGAATSNITPRLGASINGGMTNNITTHVHDELHARCLVLDDGRTKLAFVVVDSCMVPRDVVQEAKRQIVERSRIPADHVTISATHAHSCPAATAVFQTDPNPEYKPFLAERIADGVQRAINNLAPAEIGWGAGAVPDEVFNRRWHLKPGVALTDPFGRPDQVKMNPTPGSPDLLKPAGPTDPEVAVLAVRAVGGRPIALLANYSLHYVGGVGPGHASADYFGMFADRVGALLEAERLDPPFVAMMTNGTSGDINNINFREPRGSQPPYARMREVADKLAREVVRVSRSLAYRPTATLDARAADLELGVRKPNTEELIRATEIVAQAGDRPMRGLEEIYARETVLIAASPDTVPVTVQAIRIGDLGIAAIPCEVFVEIGLNLKANSPLKPMFTIELANGYNGYLPTTAQHALGGYETWRARSSYLEVDAADKITAQALQLLRSLAPTTAR